MRIFLTLVAGLMLVACASAPASNVPVSERPQVEATEAYNVANAQICGNAGGDYVRDGMLGWYQCVYRYPDGGQRCFDSSECEGQCRATSSIGDAEPTGSVNGVCQLTTSPFGCYATVENGRQGPFLCVD